MSGRQIPRFTRMYSLVFPTISSIQGIYQQPFHLSIISSYCCILWNIITTQDTVSAKHCLLEGKNWPHYNWSRRCPRKARNLPGWRSQRCRPYGEIAVGQRPPCIFPFGFHVPRGLETIFQWKRVLHISTSFPLGWFSWKSCSPSALVVHSTGASL